MLLIFLYKINFIFFGFCRWFSFTNNHILLTKLNRIFLLGNDIFRIWTLFTTNLRLNYFERILIYWLLIALLNFLNIKLKILLIIVFKRIITLIPCEVIASYLVNILNSLFLWDLNFLLRDFLGFRLNELIIICIYSLTRLKWFLYVLYIVNSILKESLLPLFRNIVNTNLKVFNLLVI